ncbi:MAG TPA: hypothetical protein DIW81_10800, partial [Planctomycetaceae bacterium]|nr:hypothetical protein [Planctomycetaceae bacterium]
HITHNGLMALTYFRRLQKLKLGGNRIEDDGILMLKQFVRLESLELAGTPITDQAIETLVQLPRIRRLYLAGTAISDVGLSQLAGVTSLLALDVRKTAVTAQGIENFQQHLPQVQIKTDAEQKPASSVIRNIDLLEMNHIQLKSNQYGEPIALKTTEQTSPATHWFDVMTELRSLKNVEIEDQHLDAEQFSKIRDLHHLQALSIKKCKLPETTLVSLCTLQNLGWLDLRDSAISDVGLKFISRIPSLSNLCLSRTQITDQG